MRWQSKAMVVKSPCALLSCETKFCGHGWRSLVRTMSAYSYSHVFVGMYSTAVRYSRGKIRAIWITPAPANENACDRFLFSYPGCARSSSVIDYIRVLERFYIRQTGTAPITVSHSILSLTSTPRCSLSFEIVRFNSIFTPACCLPFHWRDWQIIYPELSNVTADVLCSVHYLVLLIILHGANEI